MGGTEVYVVALAKELLSHGFLSFIAAPGNKTEKYIYNDIPIRRFATRQNINDLSELYGDGDELATSEFAKILDEEKPNIVHLHASTSAVSVRLVRAAKARNIPVIYTYHTPTGSCQRGTMMHWGSEPCDGIMEAQRCSVCTVDGLLQRGRQPGRVVNGVQRFLAAVFSTAGFYLPSFISRLSGPLATALRMRSLMESRHAATRALFHEVDHVVAVCDWVKQVLLRNGVPEEKITLCRQGTDLKAEIAKAEIAKAEITKIETLKLIFLGRLDATKGVHILIQAIRSLPASLSPLPAPRSALPASGSALPAPCSAPPAPRSPLPAVTLDIYGVAQGEAGKSYEQKLRRMAQGDGRIRFCAPVPSDQVVATISRYDLLAVPSQCLETGPLVVLEAFAAGVPVIGSRFGGIQELVQDGTNGMLVEAGSAEAWAAGLAKLASEPRFLERLKSGLKPPRMMATVADETIALYEQLVSGRRTTVSTANGR